MEYFWIASKNHVLKEYSMTKGKFFKVRKCEVNKKHKTKYEINLIKI